MAISDRQRVAVAKDRAYDELVCLVDSVHGWFNLKGEQLIRARKLARFMGHSRAGLEWAKRLGFINGEEEMFYVAQ